LTFALDSSPFGFQVSVFGKACAKLDLLQDLRQGIVQVVALAILPDGLPVFPTAGQVDAQALARSLIVTWDAMPGVTLLFTQLGSGCNMGRAIDLLAKTQTNGMTLDTDREQRLVRYASSVLMRIVAKFDDEARASASTISPWSNLSALIRTDLVTAILSPCCKRATMWWGFRSEAGIESGLNSVVCHSGASFSRMVTSLQLRPCSRTSSLPLGTLPYRIAELINIS
jgi:hypothetical protein